jgi:hypothetical protein
MAPEPLFLTLPTEIRQKILVQTVGDDEILDSIELYAFKSPRKHEEGTLGWEARRCSGVCDTDIMQNGTRLSPPSRWHVDPVLYSKYVEWITE